MSTVVFVPGLKGRNAFNAAAGLTGTNEAAVMQAAHESGWDFRKFNYQSAQVQTPTLARMEIRVLGQLEDLLHSTNNEPVILVGSSVGFGVLVGALSRLQSTASPIGLLGFKPIPNPLMAIELQINNPQAVAAIKAGLVKEAPMPVEGLDGQQDTFTLTAKHLNDGVATRILSNAFHQVQFNAATPNLTDSVIMYGSEDRLTPSAHMEAFANVVHAAHTERIIMSGDHASDFRDALHHQTQAMIARLG